MKASKTELLDKDAQIKAATCREGVEITRFPVKSKHGAGLLLEVRAGRQKRFVYRYRLNGKQHFYILGVFDDGIKGKRSAQSYITLADARKLHAEAVALVAQGINPLHVKRETIATNIQMPLLNEMFELWLENKISTDSISERTKRDYENIFDKYFKDDLGKVLIGDISREVLFGYLEGVRKNSKEAARKGLILMNQILGYAINKGHIKENPARLIKPKEVGATMGAPKDRWLQSDEIRLLWQALDKATRPVQYSENSGMRLASNVILSTSVANALRLIILTGVRRGEVCQMKFTQITDGNKWTIPADSTKNGRAHVITLHPLALEIIEQQKAVISPLSEYVFESSSIKYNPITGDSITRALERLRKKHLAELDPFSVHDLRRTVASGCAEYLDAPERLIELLLNHQPSDRLIRTYQVSDRTEKLKGLFLSWGDFVNKNVRGKESKTDNGNVIAGNFGKK